MTATNEFRANWNNLLGCCFGLATGSALSFYTTNLFAPVLIADLGWSRADFALLGSFSLITLPVMPFIGRFIDRVGPRIAGAIGFASLSLFFVALAMMRGPLWEFLTIHIVFGFFGVLTSSMVFGRVVVDRFDRARGLALSIMMSASPISGALAAPLIGSMIADCGWRSAYLVLAAAAAIGGILAITLIGNARDLDAAEAAHPRLSRGELASIIRHPVFLLLTAGMFLVNVPQVLAQSQLKLVILDIGIADRPATLMVSLYAIGMIGGRFLCGLALDRMKAHLVALVTLGIPTISYILIAAEFHDIAILIPAILMIGLAQGAEGDVGAFIISRRFAARNFSLLYACLHIMVSSGSAIGSVVLSLTLRQGESYVPFAIICALTAFTGALLFGLTGLMTKVKTERNID